MTKKLISYIFPIYNESGNIIVLHAEMTKLLAKAPSKYKFEIIFINDGSRDDSLAQLRTLKIKNCQIVVINFARNFGHQLAVTAGLDIARGDAAIIMDSDMQDPPKVSFELLREWERGYEVVYAQRRTRKDTPFKKITAAGFYWTLRKLSDIDIPPNTGDFRLIDRKVIDSLKQFKEHNRFLRGLVSYIGFNQTAVLFDRDERHSGETGYSLGKMLKFAADGIFGFSWAPLRLVTRVGYFISGLSFAGILYAIIVKVTMPNRVVAGWTFIVITLLFIGGMQLIMLGLLGSYIGRIYTEAQNRPLYIVESIKRSGRKA